MNSIEKRISFVYWSKESKLIHLSQQELADKAHELDGKGYHKIPYTCRRESFLERNKNYAVRRKGDYLNLYVREGGQYTVYSTNWFDSGKLGNEGRRAVKLVSDMFETLTGTSMKKAFDTVGEEFKRCVPKQFYYTNPRYLNRELTMSSIDASSHYPSCICGRMPDAHTAKISQGTVKPNEEYPFAFYLKSGHCAEYGVFDTHDWMGHPQFALCLFKPEQNLSIEPDDDVTVLMQPSTEELTGVYEHFYEIKQSYPQESPEYRDSKIVLNASIGYMHKQRYDSYRYAHLVAIALGRANQRMLDKADEIGAQYVTHLCVDGMIYLGCRERGTYKRSLGEFHQEFTGCLTKISSMNRYIAMKDGKVVKFAHGGVNRYEDGREITKENVKSLDDQYRWVKIDPLQEI